MTNSRFLKKTALRGPLCAFVFVGAATGIGALFRLWQFPETNIVVVYILSVVLTARCTEGYLWGILSTILSTCAFNAFFTAPYFTLSVDDPTYFITFASFPCFLFRKTPVHPHGSRSGIPAGG